MGPNKSHNGTKWESQKCTVFQLSLILFLSGEGNGLGRGRRELIAAPARPFVRAKSGKERACPLSVTTSQLMIESKIDRAANAETITRAGKIN